MDIKNARLLIHYARKAIESKFKNKKYVPKNVPSALKEKRGVFVTLEKYPSNALRGCIGYIEPIKPLYEAVIDAAKEAAFGDPRFEPLRKDELNNVVIEISILTVPKELKGNPKEFPEKIKIGRDGLIVEYGLIKGLLLPQVAVEWEVGPLEFLEMTCEKAGLPRGSWIDPRVKVYTFSAELFKEEEPNGRVKRHALS